MITEDDSIARPAHFVGHGEDGKTLHFASCTTPTNDQRPTCIVCPSNDVVPIVFVPGIMGSNLKAKVNILNGDDKVVVAKDTPIWRVDGVGSMLGWLSKGADEYQLRLQHNKVAVDDRGAIPTDGLLVFRRQQTPMAHLSAQQARERGWGTVSNLFYLKFLDWLEHSLNFACKDWARQSAPDNVVLANVRHWHAGDNPLGTPVQGDVPRLSDADIDRLLSYHNPVHAFGYNWLQSNAKSGKELKDYIGQVIQSYKAQGKQCEKVILVTHSMGGLVARAACKLHGMEDKVAGVFHSVMPTDGAAATYKRMVSGFGGEGGGIKGWIGASVLGPRGNFTTPTLALNAGPLELLPNARYNDGKPWLFVEDAAGQKVALPQKGGDPYAEIYTEDKLWWRPCNEAWMNPAGLELPNKFIEYGKMVGQARKFHKDIHAAGDFHSLTHAHYGNDEGHKAYGQVTWTLNKALSEAQHAVLQRHDLSDADMGVMLSTGDGTSAIQVKATLSAPDAAGDGTVPAKASAARVKEAVRAGVLVRGTGYGHDASLNLSSGSEGPRAALHAVLHILKTTGVAA
jgi:pimeloyl-ACP methyl ester carboxylesterase